LRTSSQCYPQRRQHAGRFLAEYQPVYFVFSLVTLCQRTYTPRKSRIK